MAGRLRLPAAVVIGLGLGGSACGHQVAPAPAAGGPQWIVDPSAPGSSLPPVGRSLFDFLVGGEVPLPFPALLQALEARLESRPGSPGLQIVLIPRGRSLQRDAARPDFFRYPRLVVAVAGDPRPGSEPEIALKDRLYLGYQEKAAVLEVISYNEAAGRFEFQVVRDYRPGSRPRLVYADRALCMTCHQNGAPIFSRPPWDETSANPVVAALLREHGNDYQGLPLAQGIDIPSRIDGATDRANRLSGIQLLWREGCGGDDEPSRRCRGDLLTLALARALSGAPVLDAAAEAYGLRIRPRLREQGRARWPRGLLVPSPDIPNRSPLQADVTAAFDPLLPRPPLESWGEVGGSDEGLVHWLSGLADFFTASDRHRLDAALVDRAGTPWSARATCRLTASRRSAARPRVSFECASTDGSAALTGRVYLEDRRVRDGSIDGVAIDGRDELPALSVGGGALQHPAESWRLELEVAQAADGLRPRRRDGRSLDTLALVWRSAAVGSSGLPPRDAEPWAAEASLVGRDDFETIRKAVTAMVRHDGPPGGALGAAPFRRAAVMAALEAELGVSPVPHCCLDAAGLPAPALEGAPAQRAEIATGGSSDPGLARFHRYCGPCHETPEPFPANFLHGPPAEQQRRLDQCAERIFFRLAMWGLPTSERAKTPMPPATALPGLALDHDHWPQHPDLVALRGDAAGRIRRRGGPPPVLGELAVRGYANLPACVSPMASDFPPSRPGPRIRPR